MNRFLPFVMGLGALSMVSAASAFPHLYMWIDPANGHPSSAGQPAPGGGGIYGTGGAKDYGITCAHCHTNAPGMVGTTIAPTPAWQTLPGGSAYKPNTKYRIVVTLTNETKNPGTTNNLNGFALTIENQSGVGVGMFATDAATPITTMNCTNTRVLGAAEMALVTAGTTTYMISPANTGGCYTVVSVPKAGATSWSFDWTSPAAGTGPVTIFYGVVDGDKAGTDSSGDDVKQGTVRLLEGA